MKTIKNWAGTFQFNAHEEAEPQTLEAFLRCLENAKKKKLTIRPRGSKHSWNPLIQTFGVSLSLDEWKGIESIEGNKVWVKSGTKICDLGRALFEHGLSLENQGDVDSQTISGAVSTGTHGTGLSLGNVSQQVCGIRILTASGEVKEFLKNKDPELFKGLIISLGYLGIVLSYCIETIKAPVLECEIRKKSWDEFLETWESCSLNNRHYEAFHFPFTNEVIAKTTNFSNDGKIKPLKLPFFTHGLIENAGWGALSKIATFNQKSAQFSSKMASKLASEEIFSDYSHKVFPSYRWVKFQEMEYALPFESSQSVLRAIRNLLQKQNFQVHFPIEIRSVKADDLWMSPVYQRDSIYIAVHMYKGMEYEKYFNAVESLFIEHGGRPHWGKTHTQTANSLKLLYPKFSNFTDLIQQMDPEGLFHNPLREKWFSLK